MNRAQHPLYQRWFNIMHRCYQEHSNGYQYAGALGLEVYQPWHDFDSFAEDIQTQHGLPMGRRTQLARKDINYGWYPGNIAGWQSHQDVARNRRENFMVNYQGQTKPLCEWSDIVGLEFATLWSRLHDRGYTVEEAFTTPPNKGNRLRRSNK